MIYIALILIVILGITLGCSHTFKATLVAGGKPQDVTCKFSPDSELPAFPKPTNLESDERILMEDLTAYIYNPAIKLHCEY